MAWQPVSGRHMMHAQHVLGQHAGQEALRLYAEPGSTSVTAGWQAGSEGLAGQQVSC